MRRTKFVWVCVCVHAQSGGVCVFVRGGGCASVCLRACVRARLCVVCVKFLVLLFVQGSDICWQWVAVQEKQAGSLLEDLSHNIEGKNPVLLMLRLEDADVHHSLL